MKAWYQKNCIWQETTSLTEALGLKNFTHGSIAVIGAGGKTSAIFRMAEEFTAADRRVIITTTTRMYREPGILATTAEEARQQLENQSIVMVGCPAEAGKIAGLEDAQLQELAHVADILLIEADGSKRLPLKVPAAHEPVVPAGVDRIILVAGLSGIGESLSQSCHRAELVCEILKVPMDHVINQEDIGVILKEGYLRQRIGKDSQVTVLLNQVDNTELRKLGESIASSLTPYSCILATIKTN